ncbi:unnamed protein product [Ectocarpus fasciculatus]
MHPLLRGVNYLPRSVAGPPEEVSRNGEAVFRVEEGATVFRRCLLLRKACSPRRWWLRAFFLFFSLFRDPTFFFSRPLAASYTLNCLATFVVRIEVEKRVWP